MRTLATAASRRAYDGIDSGQAMHLRHSFAGRSLTYLRQRPSRANPVTPYLGVPRTLLSQGSHAISQTERPESISAARVDQVRAVRADLRRRGRQPPQWQTGVLRRLQR